jgi:hypothetical protein
MRLPSACKVFEGTIDEAFARVRSDEIADFVKRCGELDPRYERLGRPLSGEFRRNY